MKIAAMLTFAESIPQEVADRIGRLAWVRGRRIRILEAEQVDWRTVIDAVENSDLGQPSLRFTPAPVQDWEAVSSEVLGAVLMPDDVQRGANPMEDYSPALPTPHRGFVPAELPIAVERTPTGHLASVEEEAVCSAALAGFLKRIGGGRLGAVTYRGTELSGWRRFFPATRLDALNEVSFCPPTTCAVCGAAYTPCLGAWIGRADIDWSTIELVENERGFDHMAQRHPWVVNRLVATLIAASFGSGIALDPIFDPSGNLARLVIDLVDRVRRLDQN